MNRKLSLESPEIYTSLLAYAIRSAPPGSSADLRRLMEAQARLGGLSAVCFLLYRPLDETRPCVHGFIFHTVPILVQQLSRSTQTERVILTGHIRGKMDCASTYKMRHSKDASPNTFVCLQSWRRFNRPENQLVKFMLHQIQCCIESIPSDIKGWRAWGRALRSPRGDALHLGEYLSSLVRRVNVFSNHVYLRDVELPAAIGGQHLAAARTAKNQLYANVSGLYELYQAVVNGHDWEQWADALSHTLPLPPTAGEIGELLTDLG